MDELGQTFNPQYPYTRQLVMNIREAHPDLDVSSNSMYIYIKSPGKNRT